MLYMKSGCSWLHFHSVYDDRTSVHDSFCLTRKAHRRFPPVPGTESGDYFIELSVRSQWKFKEYEIGIYLKRRVRRDKKRYTNLIDVSIWTDVVFHNLRNYYAAMQQFLSKFFT